MTEFVRIDRKASEATVDPRLARVLDGVERAVVSVLTIGFLARFIPTVGIHPSNLLLMLGECLSVWFILFRRSGEATATAEAWTVALVGAFSPLLARPGGDVLLPPAVGVFLMIVGLSLSVSAKLFLRRSFGIVAANRGVRREGPYRLVRHPMYMGYLLTHIGFMTLNFMLGNLLIYLTCWAAMLYRIRAEERILFQDPVYQAYARDVRWRLLPGIW